MDGCVCTAYEFPWLRLVRGFCLYLLGFAFCRLTDSGLWPGIKVPPPQFSAYHPPTIPPPPRQLLLSAWRIRMLSNCYSFVAMRIHSFIRFASGPSRFSLAWHTAYTRIRHMEWAMCTITPFAPLLQSLLFAPASICTRGMSPELPFHSSQSNDTHSDSESERIPFPRPAVCFLFCHAPFSRVWTEQMFYLNAHYYYFISTGDRLRGCVFWAVHQAKVMISISSVLTAEDSRL